MYVIVAYDVGVGRNPQVLNFLRTRLHWVQNSVLEGEITKAELREIEKELRSIIDEKEDSILIYSLRSEKWLNRKTLGEEKGSSGRIL